jgi:predicted dehydrogenase
LCRWFGGGLPTRVAASAGRDAGAVWPDGIEDHVAFTLEFADGVLATGSASWRHRLQNRACVATRNAWLSLDPATPVSGERLTIGLEAPNRIEELLLPVQDQLPLMYRRFADCVRGRAAAEPAAQEGVDDLRVMEAIYRAAREQRWVEVS